MSAAKPVHHLHPFKLSEHAKDRWKERWRSAWTRDAATVDLLERLPEARFVEFDIQHMVPFWDLPAADGHHPRLEVDDVTGEVKTVHPRGATKTNRRPKR